MNYIRSNIFRGDICSPSEPLETVQVLTIILGIIDVGFTADSYLPYVDEEFFLSVVIIVLVFSCICFIGRKTHFREKTKLIDMLIYLASGGVLIVSAIFMFASVLYAFNSKIGPELSGFRVTERVVAAGLGMCNGVACVFIGIILMRELQNSIYPIIPKNDYFLLVDWDRMRSSNMAGKLQVAAILLGAVDVGLTAYSYIRYSEEALFLAIVTICFVFSFIELAGNLLGFIRTNDYSSYAALTVMHGIAGLVLLSGGSLMIIAVSSKSSCVEKCGFGTYDQRLIAGILGIMNGIVYELVAYCWYERSKASFQETQYDWDYEDLEPPTTDN